MAQHPPPLVQHLELCPAHQAMVPHQQVVRRLLLVKPMLDLTAHTDSLGPHDVIRGPSSSSRTSEEQSRASLCLARSAPPPTSRFARLHPRHVVSPCLARPAPR